MQTKAQQLLRKIRDNNRQFFASRKINQILNDKIKKSTDSIDALSSAIVDKTANMCDSKTVSESLALIDNKHNRKV